MCVYIVNIESLLEKTEFFQQWQKNKNKKIERERERGSEESYERVNEMNSNYFHTDTSLREYIYTQSQR